MSAPNCDELLERYLDVCNQALVENRGRFPFKQILGAAEEFGDEGVVDVHVIDVFPEPRYLMEFSGGQIVARAYDRRGGDVCECGWKVSVSYLEDVAKNSDVYIRNPAKIDWEWMCMICFAGG